MDFYESQRYRVNISADDFGISQRANRNILYLISLGKINRVGLMAYGKFSKENLSELIKSGVKIDIHFYMPGDLVNGNEKKRSAVSSNLRFIGKFIIGNLSSKKVEAEWRKQIEKFREILEKNPDGFNSHRCIHLFPPFFKIALKLQSEYSVPYIRFGYDNSLIIGEKITAHMFHWLKKINRKSYIKSNCVSTRLFADLNWIKNADKFMDNLPEGKIEIACRPEIATDFAKIEKYF